MRIKTVGVSNYRNIELARLDLDASRVFLLGRNGQGKTNLLEAIGFITSLRAFRARENETLIGPKLKYTEISYGLEHEEIGETLAQVRIKKRGKEVVLDGEAVRRASDFVGRFPTVTLSLEDLTIVRGSPSIRRRFIDTFLCGVDRSYYLALQRYQRAVQERNALLKKEADAGVLSSFERQLASPALEIVAKRRAALETLREHCKSYYTTLAAASEAIDIVYRPNVELEDETGYLEMLAKSRRRDLILQSTSRGPHRDDFELLLKGAAAADFASDGQQRSIALSLAFATIDYWRSRMRITPTLLVDDVLGELDPERKRRFWEALDDGIQLIATGTVLPDTAGSSDWRLFEVEEGRFREAPIHK